MKNHIEGIKIRYITLCQNEGFQPIKIAALTSINAIKAYRAKYVTFDELKDLDIPKIQAFTSDSALLAYEVKYITFNQLKDFDIAKIEALTSGSVVGAYIVDMQFDKLKDLDVDKIKALTSENALALLKGGHSTISNRRFDKLKVFDVDKIKALTSINAIKAYVIGIQFDQLKVFDVNKIKELTSINAIKAYKTAVKLEDLSRLYDTDRESFPIQMKKLNFCIVFNKILRTESDYEEKIQKIECITNEIFGEDPQNRNFAKKCMKEAFNSPDTLWERSIEMLHKLCVYFEIHSNAKYNAEVLSLVECIINRSSTIIEQTSSTIMCADKDLLNYFINKIIEERKDYVTESNITLR